MIISISAGQTRDMLCAVCDGIIQEQQSLTLLDGPIGDGDHGIGMSRGMKNAKTVLLTDSCPEDINTLFYKMGRKMIATMGGSSGVIFGTMFMAAASNMEIMYELDGKTFVQMMRNSLEAVKKKGRTTLGEKTMVDAFEPAVIRMETMDKKDMTRLLVAAAEAAAEGAEATWNMISKHGHSNTLGERALGHVDPGAVSVAIIFKSMAGFLQSLE